MQRGEELVVEITDFAFGGRGISKLNTEQGDYIIFVDNAFPGQTVKTKIVKKKKRYAEGTLVEVIKRADVETVSRYQEISGAPYIFVPVELQEKEKKKSTVEVLRRLGGVMNAEELFDEFVSSPDHYFYRNKMEYSFSCIEHDIETGEEIDDAFALGFKRRGTWWKVETLKRASGLFDEDWESKLNQLREYLESTGLKAWHPPRKEGFFRHIVVRKSFAEDKLLVNLVTSSVGLKKFNRIEFANKLVETFGDRIGGIQHTINDNVADRAKIENGTCELLYGNPIVIEKLLGLDFEISMESFFQTNPKCAELLYTKAIDYVLDEQISKDEVLMDLFCGTGTIGQLLASRTGAKVVGVDIVEEAIKDAHRNAKRNGVKNVEFHAADVGKFLSLYPHYQGKIKTIVLDPPRAGIAPKTLRKVIDLGAEHIVYVSCNPATQARDTETLLEAGYRLEKISLVDQFPHTGHIESIAKYKRVK